MSLLTKEQLKRMEKLSDITLFDDCTAPRGYIATGLPGFNYITNESTKDGLPYPRMIELFGDPSHGKSTLGYYLLAQAQKQGCHTMLIDNEGAFDQKQIVRNGIDAKSLIYVLPRSVMQTFHTISQMLPILYPDKESEKYPLLILWDSIAAASTGVLEAKKGKENDPCEIKSAPGEFARNMSRGLNLVTGPFNHYPITLIGLNQTRINLSGWKPTVDTPGGNAWKFYTSLRYQIKRREFIKNGNTKIGILSDILVAKNKMAPPGKLCSIPIYYKTGVDALQATLEMAKNHDVFSQRGGYYELEGTLKRMDDWEALYRTDESFRNHVTELLEIKLNSDGVEEVDVDAPTDDGEPEGDDD